MDNRIEVVFMSRHHVDFARLLESSTMTYETLFKQLIETNMKILPRMRIYEHMDHNLETMDDIQNTSDLYARR